MLKLKQVKERLNVSIATVHNLVNSGELEAHRFGVGRGTWRVTEEALKAYLEKTKHGKPEGAAPKAAPVKLKHLTA